MSYLVNTTKIHTLTINGINYTDNLVSFSCSDSTARNAGLIVTKGQLILGYKPNGLDISEYKKLLFKRGHLVTLDMQTAEGTTFRHPRGYLYVLTVSYNPSDNQTTVELGCRLALAELTDDITGIPQGPIPLPEKQETFNNLSTYLAAQGSFVYQNNQGTLVLVSKYFNENPSAAFTSVLGETILNISPLSGSDVIPDALKINYTLGLSDEQSYNVIYDTTTSRYEIEFPMKKIIRVPPENGVAGITGTLASSISINNSTNCGGSISPTGNDPTQGRDNDTESCSSNFTIDESVQYISATNTSTSTTYNYGPAGQTSSVVQEVRGPVLEVQTSYFTDKYSYCIQKYQTACSPGGFCWPEGRGTVLQARQLTTNEFNSDGSIRRTTVENYKHILSAAQPSDWRAITLDTETGEEREEFNNILMDSYANSNTLYLDSVQITDYILNSETIKKQVITTFTSQASRGMGIRYPYKLDARSYGIKTVETKASVTLSLNPTNIDRALDKSSVATEEYSSEFPIRLFGQRFVTPPSSTTPIVQQESFPIDLVEAESSFDEAQILVDNYGRYTKKWIQGQALGLRITESLRNSITSNWSPNKYFYYVDNISGEILGMHMDACSWAISSEGAVVTFGGVWRRSINGTYVPGSAV